MVIIDTRQLLLVDVTDVAESKTSRIALLGPRA